MVAYKDYVTLADAIEILFILLRINNHGHQERLMLNEDN
jgi:hypothetical protein